MPPKTKIIFSDYDEAAGIQTDPDGGRSVDIHEFDLNKMWPLNPNDEGRGVKICIPAKPSRGKTRIIEHIMLYKAWLCPVAQAFSGTESVNGFYAQRMTPITVFDELETKALENFAKRQAIASKYLPNAWAMQIADDVIEDSGTLKKPPNGAYYKRGRHWKMIRIDATQYSLDFPPSIRSCIDYIFIPQNSIISERQKLYENFASGAIPSFKDFCDIMDQLTQDYTCLVIDNTSTSSVISDRVFYFKADLSRVPPNFKMGCPEAWIFNDERYDQNYSQTFL